MGEPVRISRRRARQLAVMGQLLAAPRPTSIMDTVRGLGMVQMDPTSVVARTEHLVLWSRLGSRFRVGDLEGLLWRERELFEYWVHIVPTSDLAMHRISMRRYPNGDFARPAYVREWLAQNEGFRRYVLHQLRVRGPLRVRDLEDRTVVPWRTGGWNDGRGRHTAMLLDILWDRGEIMIVGRDGQQRLWDLASRSLPRAPRRSSLDLATELIDRQLRARGLERLDRIGRLFDGPPLGREAAARRLEREGTIAPVRVEGLDGAWVAHRDLLDTAFRGRTTLLSPFDDLISDRDRTERLFDVRFRLEIYVPKAEREYGFFVLPILRGDRLVGRIDPAFDRTAGVLRVHAVHAEPGARRADGAAARRAIGELAAWLGASEVHVPRFPAVWR
jgi:uncharacterized protein